MRTFSVLREISTYEAWLIGPVLTHKARGEEEVTGKPDMVVWGHSQTLGPRGLIGEVFVRDR